MTIWNESEHPRDEDGKFTYKDGQTSVKESNEEKMQKRAEILFPETENRQINNKNNYNNEVYRSEDLSYPTMKNLTEYNVLTACGNTIDDTIKNEQNMPEWQKDKDFINFLDYLFPQEGGYSNRKEDLGGPTNLGITKDTYNWYNNKNNLPIKDIKDITKGEAIQIYYDYFWKQSGASSIKDKALALMYFDTAINNGPYYARKYYKESNGNYVKFAQLRKNHYKRMADTIKDQDKNYNGWINRLNNLQKYIDKNYK